MDPIVARTPTAIRGLRVTMAYRIDPPEGQPEKMIDYEIKVLDQDNSVEWIRSGDLAPYLDDSSTYLTLADRATLLDFMTRVFQEASLRILGI